MCLLPQGQDQSRSVSTWKWPYPGGSPCTSEPKSYQSGIWWSAVAGYLRPAHKKARAFLRVARGLFSRPFDAGAGWPRWRV